MAECDCFFKSFHRVGQHLVLHSPSCSLIMREQDEARAIDCARQQAKRDTGCSHLWHHYLDRLDLWLGTWLPD